MKDFYKFSSKGYLTTFAAFPAIFENETGYGREMNHLIRGNYDNFTFPLKFNKIKDDAGSKFRDVLDTRYPPAYLISDRMKSLLEEHRITGWSCYPIELYDKKNARITGYHGFSITGRAGAMDLSNQPIGEKRYREDGPVRKVYKGGYFDIDTWDGSDFFILDNSYWVIVTARVVELLKKNKITALEFERLSDMELSYSLFHRE